MIRAGGAATARGRQRNVAADVLAEPVRDRRVRLEYRADQLRHRSAPSQRVTEDLADRDIRRRTGNIRAVMRACGEGQAQQRCRGRGEYSIHALIVPSGGRARHDLYRCSSERRWGTADWLYARVNRMYGDFGLDFY